MTDYLNAFSNDIWDTKNSWGYYPTAPVWCETFNGDSYSSYDYSGVNFRLNFTSNQEYYVRVPLFALMRNGPKDEDPICNLLVFQTNVRSFYSSQVIFGEALLQ